MGNSEDDTAACLAPQAALVGKVLGMARETIQLVTDDIDSTAPAEGHTFSIDGENYVIDLSEANHQKLREALSPFIAVAKRGTSANKLTTREARAHRKVIRAWAIQNGWEISERGIVPTEVEAAFAEAMLKQNPAKKSRSKKVEEPAPAE